MIIELLELYIDDDHEIWIADGWRVDSEDLIGMHILKMIIQEPL